MKIKLVVVARTDADYLKAGLDVYLSRLKHYVSFEYIELPGLRQAGKMTSSEMKIKEGEVLLKQVDSSGILVLLDEQGKEYTSVGFSEFLQQQMNSGAKTLVFVIGGAYGFSDEVYKRAKFKVALSRLTFSHQMVRLFFAEQLYRAFTILKGEGYHH
jgi:23S rRNA (pseudouridine1915-N3)-methyltransferase